MLTGDSRAETAYTPDPADVTHASTGGYSLFAIPSGRPCHCQPVALFLSREVERWVGRRMSCGVFNIIVGRLFDNALEDAHKLNCGHECVHGSRHVSCVGEESREA